MCLGVGRSNKGGAAGRGGEEPASVQGCRGRSEAAWIKPRRQVQRGCAFTALAT